MATDYQLARVQTLLDTCDDWDEDEQEAVQAVLEELATLRASLSSLVDSSGEPPRQVREERDRLRELRDAVKRLDDQLQRGDMATLWQTEVQTALAKCQPKPTASDIAEMLTDQFIRNGQMG